MITDLSGRLDRFLGRSWTGNRDLLIWHIRRVWNKTLSGIPLVKRFEPGFLFLVWNDAVRESVRSGNFERSERRFVTRFLQPGMVAVDIGAYYGIYSLTASRKVGSGGRVIAFEPSPFQRKRLHLHLRLNRCKNVQTENVALGSIEGQNEFFVAVGGAEGFSGLRSPNVGAQVRSIRVDVTTLDDYLLRESISAVDFIKVDVEGGELDVFKGAASLLRQNEHRRPVILCELQDVRAEAWGHNAKDVADFVTRFGFRWFKPMSDGSLAPLPQNPERYEGNFVAVPPERLGQIAEIIASETQT